MTSWWWIKLKEYCYARIAQSVERQPLKLVVVGSSPTSGTFCRDGIMAITRECGSLNPGSIPGLD